MSATSRTPRPAHEGLWIVAPSCHAGHSRPAARPLGRAAAVAASLAFLGAPLAEARARPKPEPAEAARACPEMGEGFVKLPGSDTCVKLGGSVRVEVMKQGGSDR